MASNSTSCVAASAGGASSGVGWGILLCLLSCVFTDTGLILEKVALNRAKEKLATAPEDLKFWTLRMWWAGFAAFCVGQGLFAVALSLASTLILLPLGGFTLVVNVFNSTLFLSEPLHLSEVGCTLLVIAGSALAAVFGPSVDTNPSVHCILVGFRNWDFLGPAISVVTLQVVIYLGARREIQKVRAAEKKEGLLRGQTDQDHLTSLDSLSINHRAEAEEDPESASALQKSKRYKMAKWCYPMLSGATQVWTIFAGTVVSRLWKQIFMGDTSILTSFLPYVAIALWIPLAVLWQVLVSRALLLLDARYAIPADFTIQVLVNMVITGTFFGEYNAQTLPPNHLGFFLLGVGLLCVGVLCLGIFSSHSESRPNLEVQEELLEESQHSSVPQAIVKFSISGGGWVGPLGDHTPLISLVAKAERFKERQTLPVMQELPDHTQHAGHGSGRKRTMTKGFEDLFPPDEADERPRSSSDTHLSDRVRSSSLTNPS